MRHLTFAIRKAIDQENWYAALAVTLTLPDILGKVAFPDAQSNTRYSRWYEENVNINIDNLSANSKVRDMANAISGDNCRDLRNAFLHSGFSEGNDPNKRTHLHGFDFVVTQGSAHRNRSNSGLQLDVEKFCLAICEAADIWLDKNLLPTDRKILNIKVAEKGDRIVFGAQGLQIFRPDGSEVWGEIYRVYRTIAEDETEAEFASIFTRRMQELMFSSGFLMMKPTTPSAYLGFDSDGNFGFYGFGFGTRSDIQEHIEKNDNFNADMHKEFIGLSQKDAAGLLISKIETVFSDLAIVFITPNVEGALIGLNLDEENIDDFMVGGITFHLYNNNIVSENVDE